jgi:hypothetical protein
MKYKQMKNWREQFKEIATNKQRNRIKKSSATLRH